MEELAEGLDASPIKNEAAKLPGIYEFPRELGKLRKNLNQYLVEICKPSQLSANPYLRGFYFTGTRKVAAAGSSEQSSMQRTGLHKVGEVTRIFKPEDFRTQTDIPYGGSGRGPGRRP